MSSASGMLWGKTSRPAPRVSTLVPFIVLMTHVLCCDYNHALLIGYVILCNPFDYHVISPFCHA